MSKKFVDNYKDYGINISGLRPNENGDVYTICPVCAPYRKPEHRNEKKLGVKVADGFWGCAHCGWSGHLLTEDYARKSNHIIKLQKKISTTLDERIVKYFWEERRIGIQTLRACSITTGKHTIRINKHDDPSMIGKFENKICIEFNFLIGSSLVNVKSRDKFKNFGLEKNADLVFYGLNDIEYNKEAIIVEGEIDKLSFYEAGIKNVVSVPNGATVTPEEVEYYKKHKTLPTGKHLNLAYLDKCWKWFEDKDVIYIGTDNDAAGYKLREELARRLGKEKCKIIDYGKFKDANEVLLSTDTIEAGKTLLKSIFEAAKPIPVEDVFTFSDLEQELDMSYEQGIEKGLELGYESINVRILVKPGQLAFLNGYAGMGKTSVGLGIFIMMTIIKYKWKWMIYCPENYPVKNVMNKLVQIYVGNTMDLDQQNRMSRSEHKAARNFLNKYVYIINRKEGYTPQQMRELTTYMVKIYGINACYKDPWNAFVHKLGRESLDGYLENELSAEERMAVNYNIFNLISVHPPTPERKDVSDLKAPGPSLIRGGNIWWNKARLLVCVHQREVENLLSDIIEIHVQKAKDHGVDGFPTSRSNPILLYFNRRSGRFKEINKKGEKVCPLDNYIKNESIIGKQEEIEFEGF